MTGSIWEVVLSLEDAVVAEEQSERRHRQAEVINKQRTAASAQGRLMHDSYSGTHCKRLRFVHRALRQKMKSYSRRQGGLPGRSGLDV